MQAPLADEFVASVIADNHLACEGAEAVNDEVKTKGTASNPVPFVEPHDDPYLRGHCVVILAVPGVRCASRNTATPAT